MPNFQSQFLNPLSYPLSCDGVEFEWAAKNDNETLISVKHEDQSFFLKQIDRKKNFLVKGDKIAKPTQVKLLQNALRVYEEKTGAKSVFSNIHTSKNRLEKKEPMLKNIDFFANEFTELIKSYEKVCLEVGFGSGRHLLYQASANPNTLFVGAELHKPSCEQLIKLAHLQNLTNIIIIEYDARVLMEFFPSNILEKIYVHFPIPWDKKPHRRVISNSFVDEAKRALSVGGKLELRTDSDNFFGFSMEVFLSYQKAKLELSKNKDLQVSSKYEDRWKKLNKNIYDISFINEELSEEKSVPELLYFNFEVSEDHLKKETIVEKDWFVHFEKCYNITKDNYLWRVSFGDTAHVEHCYIKVFDGKISYFPKNLYATKNNLLAHRLICKKMLNESD